MYNTTQYILAAIHGGAIRPQTVIDHFENKDKANVVELSLDNEVLYQGAKKAKTRNSIASFLLVFLAFYLLAQLLPDSRDYFYWTDGRVSNIIFALLAIGCVAFIKQIIDNSYIKKLATLEQANSNDKTEQNVIISRNYNPFVGYGFDLDSWSLRLTSQKQITLVVIYRWK